MIKNPKGTDFPQGEEGNNSTEIGKVVTTTTKAASSSVTANANSTPWLRLKDPRIVRVSRVFGGKDRHSKVCTIRGLRDRRVRLSVPTAIQLYDLQDRLGLNQPSKVVDWLLNAAKHEIDELPPLPMPLPGSFSLLATPRGEANIITSAASSTATTTCQSNDHEDQGVVLVKTDSTDHHSTTMEWELGNSSSRLARPSNFWSPSPPNASSDSLWRARSKEALHARDQTANDQKENLRGTRNNINEGLIEKEELGNIDHITLLQRTTMNHHPFFPGMINNIANTMPISSNYRWEPLNYPLLMSHLGGSGGGGGGGGGLTEHNNLHSLNVVSLQPSMLSLSTGSQFLFGPPSSSSSNTSATTSSSTTQTYFPNGMDNIHDPRQLALSHFQMLSSSLSVQSLLPNPMRPPFHFGASNSTNDNIGSPSQQGKERD